MDKQNKHSVYALTKNGVAVYVGCSSNIKSRISDHKKSKVFDNHVIIESFENKHDALICERAIIKFVTLFGGAEFYNSEYITLSFKRDTQLRYE